MSSPNETASPFLRIEDVSKHYGTVVALDRVTLDIARGEFFALLGGSGSGKTTLLRCLAGLTEPDSGRIALDGADMAGVPPWARPVNTMFQSYALFPHMDVAANIGYGLRQEGASRAVISTRVEEMLALVRLEGYGRRRPHELSGGQRARVALARALAKRPKLLLLDEPLSALDRNLREATREELTRVQADTGTTFIVVTHDQEEAMTMASRLAVMDRGRLVQVGTPAELYESPNSRFIAEFLGGANVLEGVAEAGRLRAAGVEIAAEGLRDGAASVAIRPERMRVAEAVPGENRAVGRVRDIAYAGDAFHLRVALEDGTELRVSQPVTRRGAAPPAARGETVGVAWDRADVVVLPG